MTIKQSTIEAIQESKNILVNFEKYGNTTKISTTYYDAEYSYTVHCYATISANKSFRLMSYDTLVDLLKPTEYSAQRTNKANGEDRTMVDGKMGTQGGFYKVQLIDDNGVIVTEWKA